MLVEVRLTPVAEITPAIFSVSVAPVSVTCSEPELELLAFKLTVPFAAVSVIAMLPLAVALSEVAFVLFTVTVPLPPFRVSDAVFS